MLVNLKVTLHIITSIKKKTITKKFEKSRDGAPKSIQTRVVRMVTKVKGRPYFFASHHQQMVVVQTSLSINQQTMDALKIAKSVLGTDKSNQPDKSPSIPGRPL